VFFYQNKWPSTKYCLQGESKDISSAGKNQLHSITKSIWKGGQFYDRFKYNKRNVTDDLDIDGVVLIPFTPIYYLWDTFSNNDKSK